MKKFLTVLMMTSVMATLSACGSKSGDLDGLYSDKYVTLGDYKGLEVGYLVEEATDEAVDSQINSSLESYAETKEITDRAVKEGDIVNIDYVGTKEGVAFDGGTASGYDLTIGSHQFIEGFETGLIGANIGDVLDLNLTFPENYPTADLAGQPVVFNVTVNSINEKVVPELTDEIAAKIDSSCSTVEELRNSIKTKINDDNKSAATTTAKNDLMKMAVENATFKDVPQWLLDDMTKNVRSSAESYAAMYGMSLEDFVQQALGESIEQFDIECAAYGEQNAKQALVAYAIAEKENIKTDKAKIDEELENYKTSYSMSDEQMAESGQDKSMTIYLQTNDVLDFLFDNAKLK